MGAPRFNIHQTVSAADIAALARHSADVAKCHFRAPLPLEVRWSIPSASEMDEPRLVLDKLTTQQQQDLEKAIHAFHLRNYETAKQLLEPFVDLRHTEASKLYVKTLQKLRTPDWDLIAKRINKVCTDTLYVPAGSTEVVDGNRVILIHQGLSNSLGLGAPPCVIRYVVYHELLHIHLETDPKDPHPELFRRFDRCFPQRDRSLSWLQQHNFTTIEDGAL